MADITVTPAVAPSDERMVTAQRLIDAWCDTHKCAMTDIPAKAQNWRRQKSLWVLAYALRKVAHVDIIPTAELLCIEPSVFMKMSSKMRVSAEEQKDSKCLAELDDLLIKAEPRKSEEAGRAPKRKGADTSRPSKRKLQSQARAGARAARQTMLDEIRIQTARRVCEIVGFSYEQTFIRKARLTDFVNARSTACAIIFALDESKNISSIARSLDFKKDVSVSSALQRIDSILMAERRFNGWWQDKIGKACKVFDLPVERLLLKQKEQL